MTYVGKEHAIFFRHLIHEVAAAVSRERDFLLSGGDEPQRQQRWEKWERTIQPALQGSALVTCLANVEHLIGRNPDGSWRIPETWYGKCEFGNCDKHA